MKAPFADLVGFDYQRAYVEPRDAPDVVRRDRKAAGVGQAAPKRKPRARKHVIAGNTLRRLASLDDLVTFDRSPGAEPPERGAPWREPPSIDGLIIVLDTETTADHRQDLLFGSFEVWFARELQGRGVIIGDVLNKEDRAVIRKVAAQEGIPARHILSRDRFFWEIIHQQIRKRKVGEQTNKDGTLRDVYEGGILAAFNLPFDLSRLFDITGPAYEPGKAGHYSGGFRFDYSFTPKDQTDAKTFTAARVRRLGPRKAFFQLAPFGAGLDLMTLASALTDRTHSLNTACRAFGVDSEKMKVSEHGVVSPEYVRYNLRDTEITGKLLWKLIEELERHPIATHATRLYSSASTGKGYLRAMNVQARLEAEPAWPSDVLGHAMASYYGGQTECRIIRHAVPITKLDAVSMYPTVFALLDLWRGMVVADRVEPVNATDAVRHLLASVTLDDALRPEFWPRLRFIAEISPQGTEMLPFRSDFVRMSTGAPERNLTRGSIAAGSPSRWYAGPDLLASKLLTGCVPQVVRAIAFVPHGTMGGLGHTAIREAVPVDPYRDDFFRLLIEERKRVDTSTSEGKRLYRALKTIANATSYGAWVEMNDVPMPEPLEGHKRATRKVDVFGGHGRYVVSSERPEERGRYFFPPLATLITSGARLILALGACRSFAG